MTSALSIRRDPRRFCGSLGIRDLPDGVAALRAVGAYAVFAMPSEARDALVADTVGKSRAAQTVVAMMRRPDHLLRLLQARAAAASRPGLPASLSVLAAPAESATQGGLESGLEALAQCRPASGGLYLLDGVDPWFDWGTPGTLALQMDHVAAWSHRMDCCVTLILGLQGKTGIPCLLDAGVRTRDGHGVAHRLDGVACLRHSGGESWLWTRCWNGMATDAGISHAVAMDEDNQGLRALLMKEETASPTGQYTARPAQMPLRLSLRRSS